MSSTCGCALTQPARLILHGGEDVGSRKMDWWRLVVLPVAPALRTIRTVVPNHLLIVAGTCLCQRPPFCIDDTAYIFFCRAHKDYPSHRGWSNPQLASHEGSAHKICAHAILP
jgi:hypothetical protein